jgi:hypothetical protein
MGLFDFRNSKCVPKDGNNQLPNQDNTKLIKLLDKCSKNRTDENASKVIDELKNGNAVLYIPSIRNDNNLAGSDKRMYWLNFDQDGLCVLAAFTSTELMIKWSNGTQAYFSAMFSKDILKLALEKKEAYSLEDKSKGKLIDNPKGIDRILINPGNLNVFWMDRAIGNTKVYNLPADENITIGYPANPLKPIFISKLNENFEKVKTISEAYQFGQSDKSDFFVVIGIRLNIDSMHSRLAAQYAIEKTVLEVPLEGGDILMKILKDGWEYEAIKDIGKSLIYKRE